MTSLWVIALTSFVVAGPTGSVTGSIGTVVRVLFVIFVTSYTVSLDLNLPSLDSVHHVVSLRAFDQMVQVLTRRVVTGVTYHLVVS